MQVVTLEMQTVELEFTPTEVAGLVITDAPDLVAEFGNRILVHRISGARIIQSSDETALRNCAVELGNLGNWNVSSHYILSDPRMMGGMGELINRDFPRVMETMEEIFDDRYPEGLDTEALWSDKNERQLEAVQNYWEQDITIEYREQQDIAVEDTPVEDNSMESKVADWMKKFGDQD